MSFCAGKEINFNVGASMHLGEIMLPGGQLLVSGPKISFRPKDGQTVFGYEIDGKGNTIERYINGR
ncbi:MAG: hypothetical protein LBF49_02935 [Puniceicoccales bacterium]|jgi:hypothetical protein|nr:hypothetical protein [Puniceicoccales bacterium]